MLPLSYFGGKAIVYIYRPSALRRDLDTEGARDLLDELGYPPRSSPERCISELSVRLRRHKSFPHEIGLFIGYPPEDVRGFIERSRRRLQKRGLLEGIRRCGCCRKVVSQVQKVHRYLYAAAPKGKIGRAAYGCRLIIYINYYTYERN